MNAAAIHDVRQVIARYGSALDAHDYDALAALHSDDAEWAFAIGTQVVMGPLRGRDAIITLASTPPDTPPVQQRHVLTNILITGTSGGTSRATAYLTLIAAYQAAPTIVATGTVTFTLSAADEVWSIKELLISFDGPPSSTR
jgi:3-phenylpropionate/cinnamic acid dioxygenase small subunit